MGKAVGRPLKYETPAAMNKAIKKYFADCKKKREPLCITGLCLALGICRQTLLDYEKRPEFLDTVKLCKLMVEHYLEKEILKESRRNIGGPKFCLINGFGWKERHEHGVEIEDFSVTLELPEGLKEEEIE